MSIKWKCYCSYFYIFVIGNKIEKLWKKLMKKSLGIGFRNKKFGTESMLERFVVQIVVVCGVIWGGEGFISGD